MSKEIEFRAWDKRAKKYWGVQTIHLCDEYVDLIEKGKNVADPNAERVWKQMGDIILEQYVGLKDKNDKKIYEGDIIKYTSEDGVFFYSEIKYFAYEDDYPAFDFIPPDNDWNFQSNCLAEGTINGCVEVVGDIHNNPELLEVGK